MPLERLAFNRHSITNPARYIAPLARSFSAESNRYSASPNLRSATVRICDGRRRDLLKMFEPKFLPPLRYSSGFFSTAPVSALVTWAAYLER
jgi:hypothetical protein